MVLNLVQLVVEKTESLRQLDESYDAQAETDENGFIALDSIVEIARGKGYYGSVELAAGVLRASGRFHVEKGPLGKWHATRRSTALVLVALEPRTTALVPLPLSPARRALVPLAA